MNLLLDTCTALWNFGGSERISKSLRKVLTDLDNDLFISDISILEITIKYSLGKLSLSEAPSVVLPQWIDSHDMLLLPLSTGTIFELESLPLKHKDPFDRLLVCQALIHQMTIVTPDINIHEYSIETLWN